MLKYLSHETKIALGQPIVFYDVQAAELNTGGAEVLLVIANEIRHHIDAGVVKTWTYQPRTYTKISTPKVYHTLDVVGFDEGSDRVAVRADHFLSDRSISRAERPVGERSPGAGPIDGRKGFSNR